MNRNAKSNDNLLRDIQKIIDQKVFFVLKMNLSKNLP